jgi:hypothetical protein
MWGPDSIIQGLPFYLPNAERLMISPLSAEGRAAIASHGLLIVCESSDAACKKTAESLAAIGAHTTNVTLTRSFLGICSSPITYQITVLPPASLAQSIRVQ